MMHDYPILNCLNYFFFVLDLFRKAFIFDNLLFYSGLFLEFVSRACRFNLFSAKDAHLLFRVTKVICYVLEQQFDVEDH